MAIFAVPEANAGVPIKINAWGIHYGGQVVYRYQIENNSASIIDQVSLGLNSPGKELPGKPWSLNPAYSDIPVPLDAAHCMPFYGMDCTINVFQFDYMDEPKAHINMRGVENNLIPPPKNFSGAEHIRPGALSSVAEITIPPTYQSPGYLTSFGKVWLLDNNTRNPDGTIVTSVEIPFTKVDVTPPVLSIVLTPSVMASAQREKLVPISALITVRDDYDPAPEIKLVSITANEVLEAEDVRGAAIGTDDRSFSLRAEHGEKSRTGRIYTVTYSATDASGNTATASATVTVPREQEGKEHVEQRPTHEPSTPSPATRGAGALPF